MLFCELNRRFFKVNFHFNYVIFNKFKTFNRIVHLCIGIRPTRSICWYHISAMADPTKIKAKVFLLNNFSMAHSNWNPIWGTLFYSKSNGFALTTFLKVWLQNCKLISWEINWFSNSIWNYFNILMFVNLWKLIWAFFPNVVIVNFCT